MNKNLQKVLTGVLALTLVAALAGCGGNSTEEPSADTQEETTAEEATTDTQEETSALEEYTSGDGWTVQYDPSLIEVEEGGGAVDFLYLGESEGTNMVTISYEADKQPEEVLYELTSTWGNDEEAKASSPAPTISGASGAPSRLRRTTPCPAEPPLPASITAAFFCSRRP